MRDFCEKKHTCAVATSTDQTIAYPGRQHTKMYMNGETGWMSSSPPLDQPRPLKPLLPRPHLLL